MAEKLMAVTPHGSAPAPLPRRALPAYRLAHASDGLWSAAGCAAVIPN